MSLSRTKSRDGIDYCDHDPLLPPSKFVASEFSSEPGLLPFTIATMDRIKAILLITSAPIASFVSVAILYTYSHKKFRFRNHHHFVTRVAQNLTVT